MKNSEVEKRKEWLLQKIDKKLEFIKKAMEEVLKDCKDERKKDLICEGACSESAQLRSLRKVIDIAFSKDIKEIEKELKK